MTGTAAVLVDRRAERRRRLAEPDLGFREFCTRQKLPTSSTLHLERAWDVWQDERHRRGETTRRPAYADNPFRPRRPGPTPERSANRPLYRRSSDRCHQHP